MLGPCDLRRVRHNITDRDFSVPVNLHVLIRRSHDTVKKSLIEVHRRLEMRLRYKSFVALSHMMVFLRVPLGDFVVLKDRIVRQVIKVVAWIILHHWSVFATWHAGLLLQILTITFLSICISSHLHERLCGFLPTVL